ncbi:unnamed protein product [Musa textilis]
MEDGSESSAWAGVSPRISFSHDTPPGRHLGLHRRRRSPGRRFPSPGHARILRLRLRPRRRRHSLPRFFPRRRPLLGRQTPPRAHQESSLLLVSIRGSAAVFARSWRAQTRARPASEGHPRAGPSGGCAT